MSIKIHIKENQIRLLLDFYRQAADEKEKEVNELTEQLDKSTKEYIELKELVVDLENQTKDVAAAELEPKPAIGLERKEYKREWVWENKVRFALEQLKKPSTTNEIIMLLSKYDPEIGSNRVVAQKSISSMLSDRIKHKKSFSRSLNEKNEYIYSLEEWASNSVNSSNTLLLN